MRIDTTCCDTGVVTLVEEGRPSVDCLMCPLEPLMYKAMCDALPPGARVAEVGCYKGGFTCLMWHGMKERGKDLVLMSHDLFEPYEVLGDTHDIERAFDDNTRGWGVQVVKIKGDSKRTFAVHADASLDMCFVDGDHSYEGAFADVSNFWPKVKADGFLVAQDCVRETGQAVLDALHAPCILLTPPVGHYVRIFHRDPQRLQQLEASLRAACPEQLRHNIVT